MNPPVYTELIKLAAEMARGDSMPSEFAEDHPKRATKAYWLRQLERAKHRAGYWAVRTREAANQLSDSASGDA